MAIGAYGTTIPINIANSDIPSLVDISYCYHEKRSYDSLSTAIFHKLDSAILTQANRDNNTDNFDSILDGMYNLQLPLSEFNKKGFYTVYIKPKEIEAVIADVSSLTAFPNVRGLVIDSNSIKDSNIREKALSNNGLVGYRIIYISDAGARQDYYRIITSNNRCEPVVQAPNSSSDKSCTYRYDDASPLTFVTVSPSSAPTFKENATPFIGKPTQKILLVNTYFEPIMLDIEMTTHDADTISYMLENSQLRDLDNGLVTTYNDNNEIYSQSEHFTLKDQYTGKPVYEVKHNKNNSIDFSQTIDDKIS
jgi:hypothetical protein